MKITRKLGNILVITTLAVFASGCWMLGDPNNPLVLTTSENVNPEVLGTAEVVPIDIKELKEEVQALFGEGAELVLTSENHVLGIAGAIVIRLNADVTEDLLSEPVFDALLGAGGALFPGLLPFLPLLGLFSRRWRRLGKSSLKNLIPGTVGSGGSEGVQPIAAVLDIIKMSGLLDSRPEPTSDDEDVREVLEG